MWSSVEMTYRASSQTSFHHTLMLGLLVAVSFARADHQLTEYYETSVVATQKEVKISELTIDHGSGLPRLGRAQ